jgi:hypothetical protein
VKAIQAPFLMISVLCASASDVLKETMPEAVTSRTNSFLETLIFISEEGSARVRLISTSGH